MSTNTNQKLPKKFDEQTKIKYTYVIKHWQGDNVMSENFGMTIKTARKRKGLTLRALAKKVGISHPYLSQLESGHNTKPSIQILVGLSQELNLSFAYLAHLVETDIGINTRLEGDALKLIRAFEPSSLEGIESFEDFKEEVASVVEKEVVEPHDGVTEGQLKVLYERMVELSKIEAQFKGIAQLQSELERGKKLNQQFSAWEDPETLPVEQIVGALKKSGYSIEKAEPVTVDLEDILNSQQAVMLNGKILTAEEKNKALQILKLTFG